MKQLFPGEPDFERILCADKIDTITALNFYTTHADDKLVREWAEAWCAQEGIKGSLRGRHAGEFSTWAYFYRMEQRGFTIDPELRARLNKGYRALIDEKEEARAAAPKPAPRAHAAKPVECIQNLDGYLDEVLTGTITSTRAPSLCKTPKEATILKAECQKRLTQLAEDKEGYDSLHHKALKSALQQLLKTLDTTAAKLQTEKSKAVLKSKPPSVIAKGAKVARTWEGVEGLPAEKMVGAKKAYVFNFKTRKLAVFHATDAGFTFSGTTLKNVDATKSKDKILRKPEAFFKGLEVSLANLNKTYSNIIAKEGEPLCRFGENTLILCVGGF